MITILAVKTNKGYFVSEDKPKQTYYYDQNLESLLFDGVYPKKTFHPYWFEIPKIPKKVQRVVKQPNTNRRFELIDKNLESENIPPVLKYDDVVENYEGDWKDKFVHLRSLYKTKSDPVPDKLEDVEHEFKVICEISNIDGFADINYPARRMRTLDKEKVSITNNDVKHQLIDQIIFPSIALPNRPCRLTSKETYQIIREHVVLNIDNRYARITSNYDFCFEVKKKFGLVEKEAYQVIQNILRKNQKSITKYRSERDKTVFEMTYSPENHRGYTPIKPFEGLSHKDLKEKIDKYLDELMKEMNKPLKDCINCKGTGVVLAD